MNLKKRFMLGSEVNKQFFVFDKEVDLCLYTRKAVWNISKHYTLVESCSTTFVRNIEIMIFNLIDTPNAVTSLLVNS